MSETFTFEQMRNVMVNAFLIGALLGFVACYAFLVRTWQKRAFKSLEVGEKWKQAYEDLQRGRP